MGKLLVETSGRVVVLVRGGGPMAPDEWAAILEIASRRDLNDLRIIVRDDGGTVSSSQRAELIARMEGRMPMAAVLTASTISRGITIAIGWFKPGIKAFGADQVDKAAQYLGLDAAEASFARRTLTRLQSETR